MVTKEIVDDVLDELQEKTLEMQRKVKRWMYDAKVDMLRLHDFGCLTFRYLTTGSDSENVLLPLEFGKFIKQNPITINGVSIANFSSNINNSTYFTLNKYMVAGSTISISTSSNSDVNKRVIAYDSTNNEQELFLTQGTTPVAGTITFENISNFWKEETIGIVTVQIGTQSIILPKDPGTFYLQSLKFNRDVTSTEDIEIKFLKQIYRITDDYSIDEMNAAYSNAIYLYCLYRGFIFQDDDIKGKEMYSLYGLELQKCIKEDSRSKKINNFYTIRPREVT